MAAIRLLLAFLLLLLQAIAAASSDAEHLLAARSALRDPTGALASWGAGSGRGLPCRWARVTCANNSTTAVAGLDLSQLSLGDVFPAALCSLRSLEHLDLSVNEFMGPLPACLAALPALVHLNLAGNNFSGEVPPEWVTGFRSLLVLNLVQNLLSGEFPAFFANLTSLQEFSLAYNLFSPSPLPENIGDLADLRVLFVANCSLNGIIPASIGKLKNLVNLDISRNSIHGEIPRSIGNLSSLEQIELYANKLSGSIPVGFGGLKRLRSLDFSMNQLTGEIPEDMFMAPNLASVHMYQNNLSGRLPATLGTAQSLYDLRMFKASNNSFSGPLPPSLANLSLLGNLDLSHNSFSGEIPRDFGKLKQLSQLSLSDNHLSGNVPSELGDIIEINTLDLSNNELSGQLPAQLQNLKLTHFNISYNKLSGTIPVLFNGLEYQESFLGNPGLCHGFCQSNGDPDAKRHNTIKLIVYIFIAAAIILFIGLAWFSYKCTLHKIGAAELDDGKSSWMLTSYHRVDFSERDIVNSLDESNVIGQGGAGKVYKAVVRPQGETMAVKKLWPLGVASKRIDSFEAEVATLSKVRHRNIVKLACSITNTVCRLLVYEYMPSGSLGDMLHSAKRSILDWPMRYKIAVNAAEGLSYLHHDCNPPIVHRDVKSNNILLDAEYGAKVADFGVAKTIGDGPATMSVIAGSCGYIAPEYAYSLRVNEKSDIYSFGVVILELVTGMKPMAPEIGEMDLVTWVSANIAQNGLESVLDQTLSVAEQFKDEMCKVLKVALLCVSNSPKSRPPMRVVVKMLLEVKEENKPMLKLTPPNI
ncbi:uncharacterized protein [Setaria viridis]|uniref:uncharacterized protein n=1 Tax=Setaria viridis TaxID=4556 RepID=UPI003B3AD175